MSEVEWAEEYDWLKVAREGGRVRLCKGGDEHIFTISGSEVTQYPGRGPKVFFLRDANTEAEYDSRDGWSLFVERPIVALPTEPGYYLDKDDYLWRHDNMFWFHDGQIYPSKNTVRKNAPFRLLMPVDEIQAAIAKRVIAMIKWKSKHSIKSWQEGFIYTLDEHALSEISRAWGVTDE